MVLLVHSHSTHPVQGDVPPEQTQKTDEELAQERMSQWVKSDDGGSDTEGSGEAAEPEAADADTEEAEAEAAEPEEEVETDEEEAAEEVRNYIWQTVLDYMPWLQHTAAACCTPPSGLPGKT
jgi:hypothetical protein